ncbi:hypothetical protein EJ05DRAFT_514655 [Pseudovirgaria hyperparasitica]|uniref:Dilute domain-containing protein n=1 Tax=Pseudovirgaria hyperparasitica TaxID=470096 RepID=A0A6A6VWS2_9PEZI|nr:uncharacterized protein EJ05DRAFT_514655 [Pseudovirgaria hyperparasitica]KAF2753707.1 hypothetical protein EJ05DRAFT_514655 [Pseudovirgaria hyperparasitica]
MDHHSIDDNEVFENQNKPRRLPSDLPTSLDDRRSVPILGEETEIYDAWQGQSQFLTNPIPARPLDFNLTLDDGGFEEEQTLSRLEDSDSRLVQMLASQARHKNDSTANEDEETLIGDDKLSEQEKQNTLQSLLNMAASNGDVERVGRLLKGSAKDYIDIDAADSDGTPPLIYACCFGHEDVVAALLEAGANVDIQDRNQWSPLMWAMTNRHKSIAKVLLDHGASPEVKSSSGRTAFDFVAPNSEISEYLHESGYNIGSVGVGVGGDDFYNSGFSQDRFEEEMQENEMKRRMMMESAFNLEVDLGNLGIDEQPEDPEEFDADVQEFVWDRCLNDQMFVFQESDLERILDVIITNMTPQRSPSQKPVPANILFLSARYAHYHASAELLEKLLIAAMDKINDVVERHQWDMTILAFWISNATLLLHYLKKDTGLSGATTSFQIHIADLINEIFILIIRDAERRIDKFFDTAMLDHETIPGFEDIHFQNEWKIFRSKPKAKPPEPPEKRFRPPSPKRRAQIAPRNITSLLSSTLFVLDLYDVHSVITAQVLSQLLYWIGAETFNRIMSNRKYLARTKAMQIRMNVSVLEDWARSNNRKPEHYENGSMTSTGETTVESSTRHLAPSVQLLQWLQVLSSLGDDFEALVATLQQLPRLTHQQLIHAVKYYRPEVGEKSLAKTALKYLHALQKEASERKLRDKKKKQRDSLAKRTSTDSSPAATTQSHPSTPAKQPSDPTTSSSPSPSPAEYPGAAGASDAEHEPDAPENLLLDPSYMLPFSLPTSTDMLISYGAGFGGVNRERERKYLPTVPPEFLVRLDPNGGQAVGRLYEGAQWSDDGFG